MKCNQSDLGFELVTMSNSYDDNHYTTGTSIYSPTPNDCPGYDTKQSDGQASILLKFWGMQRTPSLPLFPGPLWPRVVAPNRVLSMDQIELYCVLMLN